MKSLAARSRRNALLALSLIAATGPAFANTNSLSISDWQRSVNKQINMHLQMPAHALTNTDQATAIIGLHFGADGVMQNATLANSSGERALDQEALRTAHVIHYPLLPAALRGTERTVMMQVYFADSASAEHLQNIEAMQVAALNSLHNATIETAANALVVAER